MVCSRVYQHQTILRSCEIEIYQGEVAFSSHDEVCDEHVDIVESEYTESNAKGLLQEHAKQN